MSLEEDAISKMISEMQYKKESLIKEFLRAKGVKLDWSNEKNRRFKLVIHEKHPNKEVYYYNDGSNDGLRIITFEEIPNEMDFTCTKFEMGIKLKYY